MLESSKNDVRNGFEKVRGYSLKSEISLSDHINHLSNIKWFLKPKTSKSMILLKFESKYEFFKPWRKYIECYLKLTLSLQTLKNRKKFIKKHAVT